MSLTPAHKKRKIAPKADWNSAQTYIEKITRNIVICNGKAEFLEYARGDPDLFATLLNSSTTPDVTSPNINLLPPFANLVISRDTRFDITKLTFDDKSKIRGVALKRLGGTWRQSRKGYAMLVWATNDRGCLSALLLPDSSVEEGTRLKPHAEDVSLPISIVHFNNCTKKMFARPEDCLKVLSAPGIGTLQMRCVMEALNNLSKVDPDYAFETPTLESTAAIFSDTNKTRLSEAYAAALLGAFMTEAKLLDRINTFLKQGPSLGLATALNIPKPYTKQIVDSDCKSIPKKKLSECGDDEEVLMSILPITNQFYNSIKVSTCSVQVTTNGKVGIRNGNRFQPVTGLLTVKACLYRTVINSIVNARARRVAAGPDDSSSESDDADEDDNDVGF